MASTLTVSQLNRYLAMKLRSDLKLKGVAVKGELSDFVVNSRSGHAYFSLRDETAVIKGIMFASNVRRLSFEPAGGMKLLVIGDVNIYERDGILQLAATEMTPLGIGAIRQDLEQVKQRLAAQGVFDTASKKKIPTLPGKIAVVTSPTGAALQDILNILERRFPLVSVEIYPAQMQGDAAPDIIASALARADVSGADTLILARGGGSEEDLKPFDTETVALAIHRCQTPLISAVGHETDTTLADYAADLRAPTPSAAAELAVPHISGLFGALDIMTQRLVTAFSAGIARRESRLSGLASELRLASPELRLVKAQSRLESLTGSLTAAMKQRLDSSSMLLDKYASQLFALSPFNILERGYSITMKNGSAVSASDLSAGDEITVRFADGSAEAEVKKVITNDI